FIYWFQLRSMQDSVEPARRNMQIDQRAWLGVTEVAVAPQLREGVMFNPTAYAANSGKTPALNVTQIAGWKKVPAGEQIDCAYEVSTSKPINEGVSSPTQSVNCLRRSLGRCLRKWPMNSLAAGSGSTCSGKLPTTTFFEADTKLLFVCDWTPPVILPSPHLDPTTMQIRARIEITDLPNT